MKTAIVTDSNSGITQEEARLSGVFVVPMPVLIDSKQYFEGVTLSQEQFYQKLRDGKVNVSTSQPNPFDVEELWTEILKTHDALVHIPMSSGLSETCSTLSHLAHEKFDKRVFRCGQPKNFGHAKAERQGRSQNGCRGKKRGRNLQPSR